MKLTCPSCGGIHSAEAWANDAQARQALKLVGELPGDISRRAMAYVALFRPLSGRGLSWAKALRLLGELEGLISMPHIHWKQQPARPNTATAWAQAMERVIERPPARLPLTSHGYLQSIAYEVANDRDRSKERSNITAEQSGGIRSKTGANDELEWIDREVLKKIREKNFRSKKKERCD